eukprot:CAMPEP_0184310520 /NCGR_PEP_ID=MMETSP1049-20130417/31102_1 /TAXON_ID=77928 /ORGANISM="Proteomonas sulcata, Strain CCMP704" /LENGTH=201 /DNA_ID=CAMNT_0026624797 /DNA_START=99 /DNA_END=704 /DNA_ORIENTATION=-
MKKAILLAVGLLCWAGNAQGFTSSFALAKPGLGLNPAGAISLSRGFRGSLGTKMCDSSEWVQAEDPSSGSSYWYNPRTQESTWDAPAVSTPRAPQTMDDVSFEPRLGKIMEVPESQKKNAFPGGKTGLQVMMNPLKPGVVWYKEPALVGFLGFKVGIIMWALFVGFHNPYSGDFGPFISFHDGQIDFGTAAREWARLHSAD